MTSTIIIGDGPGGLSAALFLAKNGRDVTVYGMDDTAMHHAMLANYLGIEVIHGSEFQEVGRRQVETFGGTIVAARVTAVEQSDDGFTVTLEDGGSATATFLVLTEGRNPVLARGLGLATDDEGAIVVDRSGRSSMDGAYVVGRSVRADRSQAIISAGDGAAAALDILSRIEGRDVHDWDSPPRD